MDRDLENRIRKVKYLLFDLDGTLLTSDKRLTPYTAGVLNRAAEKGYRVAFSTGRSLGALAAFTWPVRLETNAPSIGCAGGEVSVVRYDEVRRLKVEPFPLDVLKDLLSFALDNGFNFSLDGVGPRYYSRGLSYISTYRRDRDGAVGYGLDYPELIGLGREDLDRALDGTVVKPMIWYERKEDLSRLDAWYADHPGYTRNASGFNLVEVLPERVSKARALEFACEAVGIPPEECCVFGDSENDVSVMERAGVSVAMRSGFEAAKAVADVVTGWGNDEDGAAREAERLFLD